MKYTARYFKDSMPEWKRRKDNTLCRFFYRPISFYVSAFCANRGINANDVSYFSALVALLACVCYLINNYYAQIIGAVLILVWNILDSADGNLARSVKSQPFGEFADAVSSYMLVGLMNICFAVSLYYNGGLWVRQNCWWMIVLGALASESDTLMRLVYQKYKANERVLADEGILKIEKDERTDHSKVNNIKIRVEEELGICGWMSAIVLVCTILRTLDVLLLYNVFFYCGACLITIVIMIKKARKKEKENV